MSWDQLNEASEEAFAQGYYLEALNLLNQAVPEAEKDPAKLAVTLYRLGKVCVHLQEIDRAEAVLTRALAISGKVLGLEHAEVARVIDQLGNVYAYQNKFAEAEPLLTRALEMRRKLLGNAHPEVAETLLSLGTLHTRQRNYGQAELFLRDALEMQHQLLGENHTAVAETLGLLAMLFYKQNVYQESARFAQKAAAIREQALGLHPDLAMSLHIVAMNHAAMKEYDEALKMYDRVLTIRLRFFAPEHELVTSVMRAIGMIYMRTRRFAEAQALFEDLERQAEKSSNIDDLLFAMKQIAWLFVFQRNFDAGQVYVTNTLRRLQSLGKQAERAKDNLTMALFCCHVGQKDYLAAISALPAAAQVLHRNRSVDKIMFKRGFQAGIHAGKQN